MRKLYYENSWESHIYGLEYESGQKREHPNNLKEINVVSINGVEYNVIRKLESTTVDDHGHEFISSSYQYYICLDTELEGFSARVPLSELIELDYEVYYIS